MNPKDMLQGLLHNLLANRIFLLEGRFYKDAEMIEQCNQIVSSIIEDKTIKLASFKRETSIVSSLITAPNPRKNSLITEGNTNNKLKDIKETRTIQLNKEKSMNDIKSKPKVTTLKKSITKANLSKSKDMSIFKAPTPLIPESKTDIT
jgi:hypothetical protein